MALVDAKLKRLNLDDLSDVGDAGMEQVARIQTLEWLHVGKTNITDEGLKKLEALTGLTELVINNTAVSKEALANFQQKFPKLKITR